MTRTRSFLTIIGLAAGLVAVPVYSGAAQAPAAGQEQHDHQQPATQQAAGAPMKMGQDMMARMKAADAKLDELVQTMNGAQGEARMNAMAALLTELVQQRRMMHEHMQQMHDGMMGDMKQKTMGGEKMKGMPPAK